MSSSGLQVQTYTSHLRPCNLALMTHLVVLGILCLKVRPVSAVGSVSSSSLAPSRESSFGSGLPNLSVPPSFYQDIASLDKGLPRYAARPWNWTTTPSQYSQSFSTILPECASWICQIKAESVELMYWPIENSTVFPRNASLASASTSEYTTVFNGFTFTSPSVYVAYINIGATSVCWPIFTTTGRFSKLPRPDDYTISGRLYNVTRGYDAASLFTDPCGYGYGNWKTINYLNLQYPTVNAKNYGCTAPPVGEANGELGVYHDMVPWGTGNPYATPLFSMPDDVTLVNTAWQTCSVMSYGVWDPPIKLTKETAMVPAAPTLSQQLLATPRSPISTPYGPPTVISSVEDPKTGASRLLPPIPSGNPDPISQPGDPPCSSSSTPRDNAGPSEDVSTNNPTSDTSRLWPPIPSGNADPNSQPGDPPFSSSVPTDNAPPSENAFNDDSASDAPSATLASNQIHQPAQRVTGSASSSITIPIVNIQSPATSLSRGLRLSGQPAFEDAKFALSPVAPIVLPQTNAAGGLIVPADPDAISLPATTSLSGQSGIAFASAPVELDISSQLVIGALQIGSTTIPLSAASSGVFTVGGQVLTVESNAISIGGMSITPGGRGKTIDTTWFSLGSSDLLEVESTTIMLSAELASPTVFTVGEQVLTAVSNAVFMEGVSITPAGPDKTIGGTRVSLGSSGLLEVGSSTIMLSADQALPTVFTIGSEVFTPNPTEISIGSEVLMPNPTAISMDGTTITAGGPGIIIAGTPVSLVSSGLLEVGSSTILLSAEEALPTLFTVGGEVFTPNPTAISMDSTTITAGGPGVTIAGTPVDLPASGSLVIGNSTFAVIPTNVSTSPTNPILEGQATNEGRLPALFTVGGEVLTPNPTAMSMDGTTITAGGPGVTIAGTPVDLPASGSLVIGNSTFAVMPTSLSTSPTNPVLGGQPTNRRGIMFFCGVYFVTIVTICLVPAIL